jgi:hypothetical protein
MQEEETRRFSIRRFLALMAPDGILMASRDDWPDAVIFPKL